MAIPLRTYVFKVSWRGTAKFIKEQARDEDDAWQKVKKRKDLVDHWDIALIEERP